MVQSAAMTDLLLQPAPAGGPNDYEVIADDWIVGRIVLSDASPADRPWLWSLDHEFYRNRTPTHGYEATREAARDAGYSYAVLNGGAWSDDRMAIPRAAVGDVGADAFDAWLRKLARAS